MLSSRVSGCRCVSQGRWSQISEDQFPVWEYFPVLSVFPPRDLHWSCHPALLINYFSFWWRLIPGLTQPTWFWWAMLCFSVRVLVESSDFLLFRLIGFGVYVRVDCWILFIEFWISCFSVAESAYNDFSLAVSCLIMSKKCKASSRFFLMIRFVGFGSCSWSELWRLLGKLLNTFFFRIGNSSSLRCARQFLGTLLLL